MSIGHASGVAAPGLDVDLEVAGSAQRAQERVITAGDVCSTVRFQSIEVLQDVELGHCSHPLVGGSCSG